MEALVDEKVEGTKIRVLLEPRLDPPNKNIDTADFLRRRGIEVRWASLKYRRTHSKMVIIDGRIAIVGSPNWSRSAMKYNREIAVVLRDQNVVRRIKNVFDEDWGAAG